MEEQCMVFKILLHQNRFLLIPSFMSFLKYPHIFLVYMGDNPENEQFSINKLALNSSLFG